MTIISDKEFLKFENLTEEDLDEKLDEIEQQIANELLDDGEIAENALNTRRSQMSHPAPSTQRSHASNATAESFGLLDD